MKKVWEKYGFFVPGKWTYLDDALVFTLFLGGIFCFVVSTRYYYSPGYMGVMFSLGAILWVMLTVYLEVLRKK